MASWNCESISRDFPSEEITPWNAYDDGFYDAGDGSQHPLPEVVRLREPWRRMILSQSPQPVAKEHKVRPVVRSTLADFVVDVSVCTI